MRRWLTVTAISVGVVLRLLGYFQNRSLWFDEAALAVNIVERPLSGLFRPLEFHQGAPVGFLVVEKILSSLLGPSEFALRLFPLTCGLLTLLLAAVVARLYLSRTAVPFAVALVALNPALIYYSSEVKQYSSDALVTLVLLWAFVRLAPSDVGGGQIAALAGVGCLAVWFSHPAVFLLAGAGIVFMVSARSDKGRIVRLAMVLTAWGASLVVLYVVSLRHLASDHALLDFWEQYFPPHPTGAHTLLWLFDAFSASFHDPAGLAVLPGMALLVIGWAGLFRRNRTLGWTIFGSYVALLLAAFAHRYPLGSRLLIFAVPIVLLLVAEGVTAVCDRLPHRKLAVVVVSCAVLFLPALNAIRGVSGIRRDDIRPVIEYVNAHAGPSDDWYVYFQAQPQMRYYSDVFGKPAQWKLGSDCGGDSACYAKDIDSLAGASRAWIVFSHVIVRDNTDDRAILVEQLNRKGRCLEQFSSGSAHAYLCDLSVPEWACPEMGRPCLRLRKRRDGGGLRFHVLPHEILDLGPEVGIALALHMAGRERVLEPGCSLARHRSFLVVETVVSKNLRFGIVRGGDLCAAVNQAVRLIEVDRRRNVFRDDSVALPRLGDAVDLHSEQHGDSGTIQFTGQHHDGGRSPTVAEQDDAGL